MASYDPQSAAISFDDQPTVTNAVNPLASSPSSVLKKRKHYDRDFKLKVIAYSENAAIERQEKSLMWGRVVLETGRRTDLNWNICLPNVPAYQEQDANLAHQTWKRPLQLGSIVSDLATFVSPDQISKIRQFNCTKVNRIF